MHEFFDPILGNALYEEVDGTEQLIGGAVVVFQKFACQLVEIELAKSSAFFKIVLFLEVGPDDGFEGFAIGIGHFHSQAAP